MRNTKKKLQEKLDRIIFFSKYQKIIKKSHAIMIRRIYQITNPFEKLMLKISWPYETSFCIVVALTSKTLLSFTSHPCVWPYNRVIYAWVRLINIWTRLSTFFPHDDTNFTVYISSSCRKLGSCFNCKSVYYVTSHLSRASFRFLVVQGLLVYHGPKNYWY